MVIQQQPSISLQVSSLKTHIYKKTLQIKQQSYEKGDSDQFEFKAKICITCHKPIITRYLLKIHTQHWHEGCLVCNICKMKLTENCFIKENQILCQDDYKRLYGCKCCGCNQTISPNELVMKALDNIYHVDCFKCDECGDKLEKGDEFILKENRLYCSSDFNVAEQKNEIDVFSSDEIDSMSTTSPKSPNKYDDKDGLNGCKRPRTILTSTQRAEFKAAFEITPKPCRKVREKLSNDTGLSVRVVQVWFQNQRAKLKKIQKKQEDTGISNDKIKKVNNQGKITKKKKPSKPSSNPSKSPERTSPIDFHLPTTTINTQQFPNILNMNDSYPVTTNYYGNMTSSLSSSCSSLPTSNQQQQQQQQKQQHDNINNNQKNVLSHHSSDYSVRTPYTNSYNSTSTNHVTNHMTSLQPSSYVNNYHLTTVGRSVGNELTTSSNNTTNNHFQMMPHLMNTFL